MNTKRMWWLSLLLLSFLAASCSAIKLTPKQTVLWGYNVYVAQYTSYVRSVIKPEYVDDVLGRNGVLVDITPEMMRTDLTEDQKEVLRTKKDILRDLAPVIELCYEAVQGGGVPDEELNDDLVYLVNRLLEAI